MKHHLDLNHVLNNPFHSRDLNGKSSRLKEEEGIGRLFLLCVFWIFLLASHGILRSRCEGHFLILTMY